VAMRQSAREILGGEEALRHLVKAADSEGRS